MKKNSVIILFLLTLSFSSIAQETNYDDNSILMTIGNKKIAKGEFYRIYSKNNTNAEVKSVKEYLTLFENFKLKVIEAENLGLDTLKNFKRELSGYIVQLEKPYFTDSTVDEKLIAEAYERSKYDVRVSHILIKLAPDALPADTLKAYNKIKSLLNSINTKKSTFEEVAKKNSDDTYTATKKGDLGFFTVFQMVHEFETNAYNTKVEEISRIFRTKFGYHILKVTDKRPAFGEIKVAHIMVAVPENADSTKKIETRKKIEDIYKQLQNGENFANLALKNSDDKGSASKGGELDWFGTGRMVPEFEAAAFNLKNKNDYTQPIKTNFGWHIIKLIDKKEPKSLQDQKEYIKNKLSKDARADQSRVVVISRLSKEYKLKTNTEQLKEIYKFYDTKSTDIIKLTDSIINTYTGVVLTLGDTIIYLKDFAKYIRTHAGKDVRSENPDVFVYNKFKKFTDDCVINYEKTKLESKYPDFKYLVKEYHDGILLFDLTDKTVWSKAISDTVGLENFYQKNKSKFMWDSRLDVTYYTVPNTYYQKAIKIAEKQLSQDKALAELQKLAKKDTSAVFLVEDKKISKGDNEKIDNSTIEKGILELENVDNVVKFIYIKGKLQPMPKELNEIKGLITADYQNYLEQEWIKELRNKYKIEINNDVLNSIK